MVELKVLYFKRMKDDNFIFTLKLGNMVYINDFRIIKSDKYPSGYFLSTPQKKIGREYKATIILEKTLREEVFILALRTLKKYKLENKDKNINIYATYDF